MSKHTPGPWKTEISQRYSIDSVSGKTSTYTANWVLASNGLNLCLVSPADETGTANANLIAAAPCMLEMIESLFCNPEGEPCFEGSEGDREYMRQVLKKARGE